MHLFKERYCHSDGFSIFFESVPTHYKSWHQLFIFNVILNHAHEEQKRHLFCKMAQMGARLCVSIFRLSWTLHPFFSLPLFSLRAKWTSEKCICTVPQFGAAMLILYRCTKVSHAWRVHLQLSRLQVLDKASRQSPNPLVYKAHVEK